jgi:cystathionine gamma-synthase
LPDQQQGAVAAGPVTDGRALSARTLAVAAGRPAEPGAPLNPPLVLASAFAAGGTREYTRDDGNPTWEALEQAIGALEGGQATAFASGMAAIAAVLGLLPAGATVAVPTFSYSGLRELAGQAGRLGRLRVIMVDPPDTDAWLQAARQADLLWLESPANPTLELTDLRTVIDAARSAGRLVAVDNTFATPLGQQPLAIGADIVVHSATKEIGGHSDLLLGLTVAASTGLAAELRSERVRSGATPGVLEAWLALRGLRTLPVRLAEATRTAGLLADRLAGHPAVIRLRYPTHPSHPQVALARAQMRGGGTVIAFEFADGQAADRFCDAVRLVRRATSLGGVETTLERRQRLAGDAHVPAGLIRLSVGLEDPDDLWADLAQAFDETGPA